MLKEIDLLNLIQGLNLGKESKLKGANGSPVADENSLKGLGNKQTDSSEFLSLLEQSSSETELLNTLPENTDSLTAQEKEILKLVGKNSEKAVSQNSLLGNLFGSGESGLDSEVKLNKVINMQAAQSEPTDLDNSLNKSESTQSSKFLGSSQLQPQAEKVGLKIGVNNKSLKANELALGIDTDQEGLKQPKVDLRIAQQLNVKSSPKENIKGLQFSQDFINTRGEHQLGNSAKIKGKKNALNLFTKEQSQIGNSSIIKRDSLVNANKELMNLSPEAPLKIESAKAEEAVTTKAEVLSSMDNVNQAFSQTGAKSMNSGSENMVNASSKTLDMSHIDSPEKLIKELTNYIEMNKIQSQKELEVLVTHKELGNFKVNASKAGANFIDLQIVATSDEGRAFFEKHEVSLLRNLNSSGVKVSDFKLSMSADSSFSNSSGNDSSSSNNSGTQGQNSRQYNGQQSFSEGGRERRQEMWRQYQDSMDNRLGA